MTVKTEVKNQIATVILSKPEVHNAFNKEMVIGITKSFIELGRNKDVRVIVLTSEGKTFCAGADLNWMKSMIDFTFEENVKDAEGLANMLKAIADCPKPVIGRVQGSAFGGGVGLISTCDMVATIESSVFSLSEVKLGLLPAVISPFVLKKIPESYASRYFLTAEKFSAAEAMKMGLVSEVVPSTELLDKTVTKWTELICQNAPEAVSLCKVHIKDVLSSNINEAIKHATHQIAERRSSKEGQEGMKAFFEKRQPYWVK